MPSSKFFDSYIPASPRMRQQAGDPAEMFGGDQASGLLGFSSSSKTRKGDEVDAYTLYNYLAVTRIAMRGSQQFPIMGTVVKTDRQQSTPKRTIKLSIRDKEWIRRQYGAAIFQSLNEEIEPLPENHPMMELFRTVNPQDWWASFLFELLLFLELTGEAFVWMVPSGFRTENAPNGLPVQLWVIPTQWIEILYEKSGALKVYRVTPNGDPRKKKDLPPHEVLHIMMKNPRNKNRGFSPSTAGGPWLDANQAIEESKFHTFRNAITPSVWIKILEEGNIDPDDPVLERIKRRWMQRAAGIIKAREPVVIPPQFDVDATPNFKPKEMDYENSTPAVRDDILALRGVNKFIAAYTEGMNRAQVETALVHFCSLVINPKLAMVAGAFQEKLAPLFDPNIRMWFPDCSPEDRRALLEEFKARFSMGAVDPNEVRVEFGAEAKDDPDYDTGYVPGGLVPLGRNPSDELPDDGRPGAAEDSEEDEDDLDQAALEIYNKQKGNGRPHPTELLW